MSRNGWRVTRKNLDAGLCCNGDGRQICPPSKVLCRECMDMIGEKLRAILARAEKRAVPEET